MDQNAGANQRQQLRQHLHSHDRCYCRTRGMLTGKSLRDDKPHRACFSGVKIRAVQKFAAVTDDAAAEIARSIKVDERKRTQPVRWSEAIERNEAYEAFSAAC